MSLDEKWSEFFVITGISDANQIGVLDTAAALDDQNQIITALNAKAYFQTPLVGNVNAAGKAIDGLAGISFDDTNTSIAQAGANLLYDVASGGAHQIRIDNTIEYEFNATEGDFKGNNLNDVGIALIDTVQIRNEGGGSNPAFSSNSATQELTLAGALVNANLTTPFIGDFTNATHDHSNPAGGGQFASTNLTDTANIAYLDGNNGFTGITVFELGFLFVRNVGGGAAAIFVEAYTDVADEGALIEGSRARGTFASPEAILLDDLLDSRVAQGYMGTGFRDGGKINFIADEDWNAGSFPTRVEIYTTPVDSIVPVKNLEITSDGILLSRDIEVSRIPVLGVEVYSQIDLGIPDGFGVITLSEGQYNFMDNVVLDDGVTLQLDAGGSTIVFEGMRESNTLLTFSGTNIGDIITALTGDVSDLTFRNIRFDLSGCTGVQWLNIDVPFIGWFNMTVTLGTTGSQKIATIVSNQTLVIDNDVAILNPKEGITIDANNIRASNFFVSFLGASGKSVWEISAVSQNLIFRDNNYVISNAGASIFGISDSILAPVTIADTNLVFGDGDFYDTGTSLNQTSPNVTTSTSSPSPDSMTIGGWFVNVNTNLIAFTVLDQFEDFNFAGGVLLPYFENEGFSITNSTIGEFTYNGDRTVTASITGVVSSDTNDAQDRIFAFKGQIDRGSGYNDFDTPIITTVEIKKDTTQAVFTQEVILNKGDKIKYQMAQTAGGLISVLITSGTINIRA